MTTPLESIAVTGASGHLGTAIALQALDRGMTVYAGYSSFKPDITHPRLTWVQGDLTVDAIKRLCRNARGLIHAAARISVHGDKDGRVVKTNVEGTRAVLEVCSALDIPLVHVSSAGAVREHPRDQPMDETRPLKGAEAPAYDYSKAVSEQLVSDAAKKGEVHASIVRPSGIFGQPDYRGSIITIMVREIYEGRLPALITGGYDLVDVRDVALGALNALTDGRNGEVYMLSGRYITLKELARKLESMGGAKAPICIPISLVMALLPLVRLYTKATGSGDSFTREGLTIFRDGHPNMVSDKARAELGYHPRPLEDSLNDLITWWRQAESPPAKMPAS
ncbi:MAG: hypothetical protein CMK32_16145 [Porticoccaceae bacterium]|nr:hypothetical protein [Porticoccaceae bacterium]